MQPRKYQLFILSITIILGISKIILGDNLWNVIGIEDSNMKSDLNNSVLIFLLVTGFLLVYHSMINEIGKENKKFRDNLLDEIKTFTSNVEALKSYTVYEAYQLISEKILFAKFAYNTIFLPKEFAKGQSPYVGETRIWRTSVEKAIVNGTLVYELVNQHTEKIAIDLEKELEKRKKNISGNYSHSVIKSEINLMNFIIFHFSDKSKEVWFGWTLTPERGYEQPVFKSINKDVIKMFENRFDNLSKEVG